MICTNCGKAIADDLSFCPGCGSPIMKSSAQPANNYDATVMADPQSLSGSQPAAQEPLPTFGSAPAQQPIPNYNSAPAQAPLPTYGAPAQQPLPNYGAPVQPPVPNYNGAPVYTAPPAPNFKVEEPVSPEDAGQESSLKEYEGNALQAFIFGIISLAMAGPVGLIFCFISKAKQKAANIFQFNLTNSKMRGRYESASKKLRLSKTFTTISLILVYISCVTTALTILWYVIYFIFILGMAGMAGSGYYF